VERHVKRRKRKDRLVLPDNTGRAAAIVGAIVGANPIRSGSNLGQRAPSPSGRAPARGMCDYFKRIRMVWVSRPNNDCFFGFRGAVGREAPGSGSHGPEQDGQKVLVFPPASRST